MVSWMHSAGLTLVSSRSSFSVIVFLPRARHLVVGKWLGVSGPLSIGSAPKLFGFQWGETEYRVSLLPLGVVREVSPATTRSSSFHRGPGRGFLSSRRGRRRHRLRRTRCQLPARARPLLRVNVAPHRDLAPRVGYVKPGFARRAGRSAIRRPQCRGRRRREGRRLPHAAGEDRAHAGRRSR